MTNKTASVIIPVYNTASYLERAVDAVLRQSYTQTEVILVDDGSTDDSLKICEAYQERDSRVIVCSQANAGASTARNRGLDLATGEYVMFVDSDDWIDADMLNDMVTALDTASLDLAVTQVPGDSRPYSAYTRLTAETALEHVLRNQIWWSPFGKLFRRSALHGLRFPQPTIAEDYLFNIRLLLSLKEVLYLPQTYYHRTARSGSLSNMALCERSFDEVDNVLAAWQTIKTRKKEYAPYAERNLAETLLKLLIMILTTPGAAKDYSTQETLILSLIRTHYRTMLANRNIPLKQRVLLSGCFSHLSASLVSKAYTYVRKS